MNKVLIKWNYKPKNLLEDTHEIDFKGYQIQFKDGRIVLTTTEDFFNSEPDFLEKAEKFVKNYLNGISIQSHSSYDLNGGPVKILDEDGNVVQLSVTAIGIGTSSFVTTNAEVIITDKYKNVIYDSKKERINEMKSWGRLTSNISEEDEVLLEIYANAIKEPENEFIHLFEILEYISEKFGGRKEVIKKLNISQPDINTLATIANDPHIKEGRHRGKMADKLRKASPEELISARRITKNSILKYLRYQQSKEK